MFYERWEVSVPCLHSSKAAFALVYMLIIYILLVNKVIHKFTNSIQFFKNGNKEATLFFKTQNILLFSVVFCPVIHNIYSRKYCLLTLPSFFIGTASARSYKIGVVGNNWLVGWLVGNAVFSETALSIFLIFCMKLGNYKGRKVTEQDFWKKFLIWRYSWKSLQIIPKSDTSIFFSKAVLTFFWFLACS